MRHIALLGATVLALAACADTADPIAPDEGTEVDALLAASGTPGGRIAFSSLSASEFNLFTVNPDGTGLTPLTTFPGSEVQAAWSWDNGQLVLCRGRSDGANTPHHELFVLDQDGGNGHWVTPSPLGFDLNDPAWSPDGSRIVANTSDFSILVFDAASGAILPATAHGESASYDATGTLVVYSNPGAISVVSAADLVLIRTIQAPAGTLVKFPRFSPDGKRIAFSAFDKISNSSDIWLVNTDGTGMVRLVGGPADDSRPTWSPDGGSIAYASVKRGRSEIYRTSATGGRRIRITSAAGFMPAWTH